MGHATQYYTFPEKTSKEKMLEEAEDFAFYNVDRGENPSGSYHGWWRLYSGVMRNRDEAMDFLDSKGAYQDGAVKFYNHDKLEPTAKITKLKEKKQKLIKDMNAYAEKNAVASRSSKLVTCPNCESKINKKFIKVYSGSAISKPVQCCPLCKQDIFSNTVDKRLEKYLEDIKATDKAIKEANEARKAPICWLMKVEVHC